MSVYLSKRSNLASALFVCERFLDCTRFATRISHLRLQLSHCTATENLREAPTATSSFLLVKEPHDFVRQVLQQVARHTFALLVDLVQLGQDLIDTRPVEQTAQQSSKSQGSDL